ncbi:MAG: NUDIX domain-containing protein [Rickettsiales bacterium]|jgi:putative (di)nucleoside polyphosphate hydrolase|nr:NUDIX domain-containing protein [Rickettsiales bacterium]
MNKFRKAVGAIILNKNSEILAFNRADFPDTWQGVEGGIDERETTLEALYRELFEEINLSREKFEIIKETKQFIKYLFNKGGEKFGFVGQEKKFYLVKIIDDFKDFKYDNSTQEVEFIGYKVMTAEALLNKVPPFKKEMYRSVLKEFGLI